MQRTLTVYVRVCNMLYQYPPQFSICLVTSINIVGNRWNKLKYLSMPATTVPTPTRHRSDAWRRDAAVWVRPCVWAALPGDVIDRPCTPRCVSFLLDARSCPPPPRCDVRSSVHGNMRRTQMPSSQQPTPGWIDVQQPFPRIGDAVQQGASNCFHTASRSLIPFPTAEEPFSCCMNAIKEWRNAIMQPTMTLWFNTRHSLSIGLM